MTIAIAYLLGVLSTLVAVLLGRYLAEMDARAMNEPQTLIVPFDEVVNKTLPEGAEALKVHMEKSGAFLARMRRNTEQN